MQNKNQVRWFRDIRIGDVALVGGKNASLGELYAVLYPLATANEALADLRSGRLQGAAVLVP